MSGPKFSAGNTGPSLKQIRDAHKEWFESSKTMEGPAGNLAAHHRAQLLAWLDEARDKLKEADKQFRLRGVAQMIHPRAEIRAFLAKLD